ncbi:YetF domain-containing protein [Pantoea sp. FN060301]|uniref:YetF domain-containing protein n=1 Tax=Pantoea sp. FN060301 TaxID=3420380 RepID=UPI003D184153
MFNFDWHRFFLNDLPMSFLGEVAVRVLFAYLIVFAFLKISGRRGIRQLSLFELVIILTLGSASGDVTFYDDVPVLPVAMVFVVLLLLYRFTTFIMARSPRFSNWVEGEVITLIQDGLYELKSLRGLNISEDEFFMELRQDGVEHLGQVRLALIELDGQISTFLYDHKDVRPGLSVLPPPHRENYSQVPVAGTYACNHCGQTQKIAAGCTLICPRCQGRSWSVALSSTRPR